MSKIIKDKFKYHVDASLFAFKWPEAQYIEVEYCASRNGKDIMVAVTNISGDPYLLGMIAVNNNWIALMNGMTAAATDHAGKELNPVDPIVMKSIAPFAPFINN